MGREPRSRKVGKAKTIADLIDLHIADLLEVGKPIRRSKRAVLEALKRELGATRIPNLDRSSVISFGKKRAKQGAGPVTLSVDLSYLHTILTHAAAVHGINVNTENLKLARIALSRFGLIGRSNERDRRPSEDEIAEFLKVNEKVRIELHSGPYDTIERMLLDDRAEIGFLRLPMQRKGLEARPLLQVRTVCVLPKNHPLAAQKSISIDDLHSVPLILLGRQRTPRSELDIAFLNAKLIPRVKVETHSVCSACGMAASGIGVALVNELMARDYSHLELVIGPLKEVLLHRFAFAISAELPATQAAEDFMGLCATRLDKLLTHALP